MVPMGSLGTVLPWHVVVQGALVLYAWAQTEQYILLVDNRSGDLRGAAAAYNASLMVSLTYNPLHQANRGIVIKVC